MEEDRLKVGAAAVSLNELFRKYFEEEGYPLRGEKGEQKIRCIVFDCEKTLTALFNADFIFWPKDFVLLAQNAIEVEMNERPIQLLFFATHNHTGPGIPKPLRDCKKQRNHWLVEQTLQVIVDLFRQVCANRRRAFIKVGKGIVDSISANSDEIDGDYERNVYVFRIDDVDGNLIGVLVNFPCHPIVGRSSYSSYYFSGDFPGVMEVMVQKVYGNIPILFINGAAGDMLPVYRRISLDFASVPRTLYEQEREKIRWSEMERIGCVLGGEVCKVLAELEVAGKQLAVGCNRWNYAEWEKHPSGLLVTEPAFVLKSQMITLTSRITASLEECEQRIKELEQQIKQIKNEFPLPYSPKTYAPYLLKQEEAGGTLFELMRLNAELGRWKSERGGAKRGRCLHFKRRISVLGISREVGAVCFPGEMFHETAKAIRQQSPFNTTLIFGYMMNPDEGNIGYLTTASKIALGGQHSVGYGPEAEEEVIRAVIELLSDVWESFV